jgi:hypothetical protein
MYWCQSSRLHALRIVACIHTTVEQTGMLIAKGQRKVLHMFSFDAAI